MNVEANATRIFCFVFAVKKNPTVFAYPASSHELLSEDRRSPEVLEDSATVTPQQEVISLAQFKNSFHCTLL